MNRGESREKWSFLLLTVLLIVVTMMPMMVFAQEEYPRDESLVLPCMWMPLPDPENLNRFTTGGFYSWRTGWIVGTSSSLWFSSFHIKPPDNIVFMTANSYEYFGDFTGITIELKNDVMWSDGEPFTSEDVVFTINMLRDNLALRTAAPFVQWVADISAPDDDTVVIEFTGPNPRFANSLDAELTGGFGIVPKHKWEGVDPLTYTNSDPVHTGPYELVFNTDSEQIYQRVENWWGEKYWGKPEVKYVDFIETPAGEQVNLAISLGTIDTAISSYADFLSVSAQNPYLEEWGLGNGIFGGWSRQPYMNMRVYPWSLKEVRRALSLALNRTKIGQVVWDGTSPGTPVLPPGYPWMEGAHVPYFELVQDLIDEYEPDKYDPEEAESIFEGLGFTKGTDGIWVTPNGTRLEMAMITWEAGIDVVKLAEVIASEWETIGVDVYSVQKLSPTAYTAVYNIGDFDCAVYWMAGNLDPLGDFQRYHSKHLKPLGEATTSNQWRYNNSELDAIVDQLEMLPYDLDNETIADLYYRATEILMEDVAYIPTTEYMQFTAYNTYYWTGHSNIEDPYGSPIWWHVTYLPTILRLESTGRLLEGLVDDPIFGRIAQTVQLTYWIGLIVVIGAIVGGLYFFVIRRRT